ncbi:ABC transporter permease [Spiroplasma culicicola]|uniref:Transmembrane protein n=1 Tax=Spiroplasma culicicola AES-1 TaxID=1276246 RepID=W6AH28_9MOLU|nr:ABC transporter permease [Spiroplasma culicicola]AHI52994.1 transmembrane protein [Spiroplasma culicicola AES-1]
MMDNKSFLYKSIPFRILLLFNIKNIFNELVFLILNLILLLSSVVFATISNFFKEGSTLVVGFNFYVLFYISCLLFILILRMVQFFYHNKIEDKTIFIALSNQVSRNKLFISQWILMFLVALINIASTFILINIFNFILAGFNLNYLLLRITTAFLIYGIIASFILINFILFLIFIFSLQSTTIICTLLLSCTFIANLPVSFQKTNEKNMTVKFKNNQLLTVTDLYETFDFQKYVNQNQIKYNNLSKYINDQFLASKFDFNSFNVDENIINQRINNIWSTLGIINSTAYEIKTSNLTIRSLPQNESDIPSNWSIGDKLTIDLSLKNTFISLEELKILGANETEAWKKQILEDLYSFSLFIQTQFSDIQLEKAALFNEFIFIDDNLSQITNVSKSDSTIKFKKDYLLSMYNYQLNGTYKDFFTLANDTYTYNFVREQLNFPLMISVRILEQYFIKYTSRFLLITNNSVLTDSADWSTYIRSRTKLNIFLYFNLFNGMWSNYTYYSGYSYDDFWFLSYSDSKIVFDEQQNIFLGYPEYTLKLDENNKILPNTHNNYINPMFYIAVLLIFSLFNFSFVIFKFNRIDLK